MDEFNALKKPLFEFILYEIHITELRGGFYSLSNSRYIYCYKQYTGL